MRIWIQRLQVGLLATLLFGGCSTSKPESEAKPKSPLMPLFQPIASVPEGRGLVYIYREWHFWGGNLWHAVSVNDILLAPFYDGSYFPVFAPPGTYRFGSTQVTQVKYDGIPLPRMKGHDLLELDVKAGETYYVKLIVNTHKLQMIRMDEKTATNEIQACRLTLAYHF